MVDCTLRFQLPIHNGARPCAFPPFLLHLDHRTLPNIPHTIAFGMGRSFDEYRYSCYLVSTIDQPITILLTTIHRQFIPVMGVLAFGRSISHNIP